MRNQIDFEKKKTNNKINVRNCLGEAQRCMISTYLSRCSRICIRFTNIKTNKKTNILHGI